MAGTKAGGKAAAATNKAKYGEDFYKVNGAKGGKKGTTGGFATRKDCTCNLIKESHIVAECAGKKGGKNGKR